MKANTTRVSAYGLITDCNNRVLLCRLAPIVEHNAGKWILPGGGIDHGEHPMDAVVREVKEETALKAHCGKLLDIDSSVFEFSDRISHAIRVIYQATVDRGELKIEANGSTDACDWFTRDAIKHLPMTSLAQRGMKLLGWTEDGQVDQREKMDLSLSGLIHHFQDQGGPRSNMVVDYLQELYNIHDYHNKNSRRRLDEMRKYK